MKDPKNKLKIGIIVDDLNLNFINKEIIYNLSNNEKFKIDTIILKKKNQNNISNVLIKYFLELIIFIEKIIFINFFKIKTVDNINLKKICSNIINIENLEFNDDELTKISDKNLDLILKMEKGNIKGKILEIPKFGVISCRFDDKNIGFVGPVGFWQVYFKKTSSSFTIIKHKNNDGENEIIFEGSLPTKNFYYHNKIFIFKQTAKYIDIVCQKIYENNLNIKLEKFSPLPSKHPKFFEVFYYLTKNILFFFFKLFEKISGRKSYWKVGFKEDNFENYDFKSFTIINDLEKNRFLADPFLFKHNNFNYLFAEDYNFNKKKGVISCYQLNKDKYKYIGKALEEDFHLSFPFIFQYNNEIFMCPETHKINEIRLYQSTNFPLSWKYKTTLIRNIYAIDTIIFEKDNIWWLLTTTDKNGIDDLSELSIFYSKDGPLTNNWIPHKLNPIYVDPLKARNGGILFQKDEIFRINQKIDFNSYGKEFNVNKIIKVDENNFEEKLIKNIKPDFFKNIFGTHHMNNNEDYTVFDFLKKKL